MSENPNIDELIIRYFQQDITEDDLRLLETWLEESPEHKAQFFELKDTWDYSWHPFRSNEKANEAGWIRMKARLLAEKKELSQSEPLKKNNWKMFFRYVAIILLTISLSWGIHDVYHIDLISYLADREIAYNEIQVEKGGRANTLILSDGSKVILNAATKFRYPTDFSRCERRVFLDGEAYFEVSKNEAKPFIVQLKKQDIKVLGTSFNVEAYSDDGQSSVALLTGSIRLDAYNDKGEKMSTMFLKPNQVAHSDNQTGSVSVQNTDATLACAWVKGEYKFRDESLSSIARRLEYYYGVTICLQDEELKQVKYTGTFSLDQDIRDVFRIIDYEKRLHITYDKKNILITEK